MILVLTLTTLLLAVYALGITLSNYKRINQIERDLTEKGTLTTFRQINPKIVEEVRAHTSLEQSQLKEAGVQEQKAKQAADLAKRYEWQLIDIQANIKMLRFMRAYKGSIVKVNVYYGKKNGTYTVATALQHPTKGKTQLFRKGITTQELEAVLKNPRTHTDKGYYKGALGTL